MKIPIQSKPVMRLANEASPSGRNNQLRNMAFASYWPRESLVISEIQRAELEAARQPKEICCCEYGNRNECVTVMSQNGWCPYTNHFKRNDGYCRR